MQQLHDFTKSRKGEPTRDLVEGVVLANMLADFIDDAFRSTVFEKLHRLSRSGGLFKS